ncbi:uncharacterized protein L969DRAFT_75935 [Mixia osmundae IAM 14324]|uniref:Major facilitator superfamily (MFS) profile domain-containing protein n=1 Tax=Mixia osmundae (strain CBS 9802 / IAM 14324 / JCM 22182 / KY 12970) TaxID=764103 RepID=G7E6W6_MIXOS|nr:uncharacterized protein L969DRAFT_75935 [Mixia osmundae IAM 14324]KEI39042.1 hypothetical protein L969DRAFT_75935 [Mixia osmundae IAM 14324]GAA98576.1 hypothetical protein E5Q_05263 [Mixia osmundae IAM 14324]
MPGEPISVYVRDTFFGLTVRLLSKQRFFKYDEEEPGYQLPECYAQHCQGSDPSRQNQRSESELTRSSTQTAVGDTPQRSQTGDKIDDKSGDNEKQASEQKPAKKAGDIIKDENGEHILVDWHDDDPHNPMNWPTSRKVFVTALICFLTFGIYVGASIYTPGIQSFIMYFNCSKIDGSLGLTMFVLGYGVGPLFLSAPSEIPQIGRTIPYIISMAIFVILQIPTALAPNVRSFLVLRFLAGFVGSPPLATGGATMQDLYSPKYVAFAIATWGISAVCGPTLGPVMSAFVISADEPAPHAWQWAFWLLLAISGAVWLLLFFTLPETSGNNILTRRAQRLRQLTGNPNFKSQGEIDGAFMTGGEIAKMTLVRPILMMFTEPIVFFLNLYIAFLYAILYLFFELFDIVFEMTYGFTLGEFGLSFLGTFVGSVVVLACFYLYLAYIFIPMYDRNDGNLAPESRLVIAMVGAPFIPISLFWFGWTAGITHWMSPIVASSFFSIGTFLMFQAALTYLGDSYKTYAASVYAGNDFFRSMMGGVFPIFGRQFYNNLGGPSPKLPVAWGSTLLGCIGVLLIPIPFVLHAYGARIRKWSKMAD